MAGVCVASRGEIRTTPEQAVAKPNVEVNMKVTLDAEGKLKVTAESHIESYALKCWAEKWEQAGKAVLTIDPNVPAVEVNNERQ